MSVVNNNKFSYKLRFALKLTNFELNVFYCTNIQNGWLQFLAILKISLSDDSRTIGFISYKFSEPRGLFQPNLAQRILVIFFLQEFVNAK